MSRKKILSYLQNHILDLHSLIPTLLGAEYEGKPPKMVLKVSEPLDEVPIIKSGDFDIPIEVRVVEVNEEELPKVAESQEDPNVEAWRKRHPLANQGEGHVESVESTPDIHAIKRILEAKGK